MHDLILNNEIIKSHDFQGEIFDPIPINKGVWLERVDVPVVEEPGVLEIIIINHVITETQSRYEEEIVDRFSDIEGGLTKEEQDSAYLAQELSDSRTRIQTANRAACESFILSLYPGPIQQSAALGIYPQATIDAMTDHIARCIAEENRVFDLLEVSTDPESVVSPVYPEV